MVTALWALFGALLGLTMVLLLIWYRPSARLPSELDRELIDRWAVRNRLHADEVDALRVIADAATAWKGRYQRRKKTPDDDGDV